MTGQWVDDLGVGDQPVQLELTQAGRTVGRRTLTTREAAEVAGVVRSRVLAWVDQGALTGVQVDGRWLFDREAVLACAAYMRSRRGVGRAGRKPEPRVAAGPLLELVAGRGGDAAVGVRPGSAEQMALGRARVEGSLTVWAADRLAVRLLGLSALEVWGNDYLTA